MVIVGEEALSSADLFLLEASAEERGVKRHALFTDFLEGLDGGGGGWGGYGVVRVRGYKCQLSVKRLLMINYETY